MARVTVEDCAEVIPSRFELVALAAQRARIVAAGGHLTVERNNDKDAVIALREIAERTINIDHLRDSLVLSRQKQVAVDEYGVEIAHDIVTEDGISSDEIREEMTALQVGSDDEDDDMIYSDDVGADD